MVMSESRTPAARGVILLLDDSRLAGAARAEHLEDRGFQVRLASTVDEAEALWEADHFTLVLVAVKNDLVRAVEFCDRIKNEHPNQTIGLLVPGTADLPVTHCPDLMWPEEDINYFLARVDTLAAFSPAM